MLPRCKPRSGHRYMEISGSAQPSGPIVGSPPPAWGVPSSLLNLGNWWEWEGVTLSCEAPRCVCLQLGPSLLYVQCLLWAHTPGDCPLSHFRSRWCGGERQSTRVEPDRLLTLVLPVPDPPPLASSSFGITSKEDGPMFPWVRGRQPQRRISATFCQSTRL